MSRVVRVGWAVLAALALLLAPGAAHADERQTGLGLDITASQQAYKPGEQVALTFHITNHGTAACQVGTIADGEVLIGSVTRDGASQPWQVSQDVRPAAARKGSFTGLLGNFDGKSAGDLVSRDGKAIPDQPGFDDLYKVFGDSWRLSQSESMLEYGPGQSTAAFTDRAFPDKPVTVAELPQPARDNATAMCKAAGVKDATLLEACVVDVARTGQPSFAAAYAPDQRNPTAAGSNTPPPSSPPADHGETEPGAILEDGDVVTGHVSTAGDSVDYGLNLAAGQQFELVDVTRSVNAAVPDATIGVPMLPGPYQFAVTTNDQAKLRISLPNGATGKYSFRYVTLKPRTIPIEVGAPAAQENLDEPGRVDVYRFSPPADVTSVQVSSDAPCEGGPAYGYSGDTSQPNVLSPGQLCFSYAHPVSPGTSELILVWSDEAKKGAYSFSLQRS